MSRAALAAWFALAACETAAPAQPADAGPAPESLLCEGAEGADTGTEVGQLLPDLELLDCGLQATRLHEAACGHSVLLLTIGAKWCQVCVDETPFLRDELHAALGDQGLQVVQILFEQDQPGDPATSIACQQWRDEFELPYPVLIDPTFASEPWFGDQYTVPLTLLVGHDGRVARRWTGIIPPDLLQAATEALAKR